MEHLTDELRPDFCRSTPATRRLYPLPNGMEIAYQSRSEVSFFYRDIFEKGGYLKHGITLGNEACVFDVGANIGLFTLFIHQQYRDAQIYAFEPAPPVFEILHFNTMKYGVAAKLFNCGLSDAHRTAPFTFYPNSSGMSSVYGNLEEESEVLRAIMNNQLRQGEAGMEQLLEHAEDLLGERFKSQTFHCTLRTFSEIIDEHNVGCIDLLKIDVQKSELDVMRGIDDADWKKIRQVVLEVHDLDGRLERAISLLTAKNFSLVVEQDQMYEGSILYNLYAIGSGAIDRNGGASTGSGPAASINLNEIRDRARRQKEAQIRHRAFPGEPKT
jgi:FkbM family methyltransferase